MVLGKYYGVQHCLNRVYSRVVGLALVLVTHQILPLNYLLDSADDSVLCLPPSVALESRLPHTRNQSCRKSENKIKLAVLQERKRRDYQEPDLHFELGCFPAGPVVEPVDVGLVDIAVVEVGIGSVPLIAAIAAVAVALAAAAVADFAVGSVDTAAAVHVAVGTVALTAAIVADPVAVVAPASVIAVHVHAETPVGVAAAIVLETAAVVAAGEWLLDPVNKEETPIRNIPEGEGNLGRLTC